MHESVCIDGSTRYLPCKGRLSGDRSRWPFGEQHLLEKSFICLCILAENIALKNQIYFSILNLETQSSAFHKNWICYSSDAVWGDIGFQDQGSFWVVWVTEI